MMRLDKFLAHCSLATRSEAKKLIRNGEVLVNGTVVRETDYKVDEENDVVVLGAEEASYSKHRYYMLNKPQGYITATKSEYKETIFDLLDIPLRGLFPVGRLDKDTEGLLLITDNGDMAHQLLSPKHHVDKTYYVEISNPLLPEHIELMEQGITIDKDEVCKPAIVEAIDDHSLYLTITEGKYHQVKRMIKACGSEVTFLKRIRMGSLVLDETLPVGQFRPLSDNEISALEELCK